jgi:hypothetical protein
MEMSPCSCLLLWATYTALVLRDTAKWAYQKRDARSRQLLMFRFLPEDGGITQGHKPKTIVLPVPKYGKMQMQP